VNESGCFNVSSLQFRWMFWKREKTLSTMNWEDLKAIQKASGVGDIEGWPQKDASDLIALIEKTRAEAGQEPLDFDAWMK
jgi:hypothetical protein